MRAAKHFATLLPVKNAKLLWDRLTFSRLTIAYVLFSVAHCVIQVSLQIRAFTINADAASFLFSISAQAHATDNRVPVLGQNGLSLCTDVPSLSGGSGNCTVIWSGSAKNNTLSPNDDADNEASLTTSSDYSNPTSSIAPLNGVADGASGPLGPATVTVMPTITVVVTETPLAFPTAIDPTSVDEGNTVLGQNNDANGIHIKRALPKAFVFDEDGKIKVNISGEGYNDATANLSESCVWALNWPVSILDNTKREDITFIAFQIWVLGMSIVALLNESIPHIFASLLTHVMATGWAAYQIVHTEDFRKTFGRVITGGACNGLSLLPDYWNERAKAEYPGLALNVVALLVSAFLSWRLVKLFGWQTFKRVGASITINRIYKLVLVLSIVLQLAFFFIGATVSLWLDNLFNGVARQVAWYTTVYKVSSFITLALLIPWIATGWFSVRHELRLPMFIFLLLSLLYLGAWSVMFLADTFRWAFVTWRFFTFMATASVLFTIVAFVLGVVCRYNFGKGLPRYLSAQEPLPGDDFTPVTTTIYSSPDPEKLPFPSNEALPTFSATFGSGPEVPPPMHMFPRGQRLGPRFYNSSLEPFEGTASAPSLITIPGAALTRTNSTRTDSTDSSYSGKQSRAARNSVGRGDSYKSVGTVASYYSYSPSDSSSRNDPFNPKRWVIE